MKPKARVIISLLVLAGIGLILLLQSSPNSGAKDPAYTLASIDCAARGFDVDQPNPVIVPMRKAFADLCRRVAPADPLTVASEVNATREDLAQHGIQESNLDVCMHLAGACPANFRPDIQSIAAGYMVLREPAGG